jgi:hypothetical protein
VLFVTDSDLNETEHTSLLELAAFHKPLIVVLNKCDLYSPEQRERLLHVIRHERLRDVLPPEHVITSAADPREREYVIQAANGTERSEWRKPQPDVADLKTLILELLEREGLALIALNAALYAADKTDRVAALRVQLRNVRAQQVIWSYAALKAIGVGMNPFVLADVLGGTAIDAAMIVTLAAVYGFDMSRSNATRAGRLHCPGSRPDDRRLAGLHRADVAAQGTHVRPIDDHDRRAPGAGRGLWLVYRRTGRPVLLRARGKLGQRKPEVRRPPHSGQDRQGVGPRFHLVGHISSGRDAWKVMAENYSVPDFEVAPCGIEYGFSSRADLVGEPFKPYPLIELHFVTKVPWVISDPEML